MAREIIVNLSSNGDYWQADWHDSTGKRLKKSLGSKSEVSHRQARKLCQQLANTFNKKPALADAAKIPSLGNFIDGYVKSRTDIKPPTKYLFELTGKYLKMFFGEKTLISQITRQQARDWRTALAHGDFSGGRAMAEVSVCHRCGDARTIFKRAVDDDLLLFNPFDRLKARAPRPDKDWHYVSIEQLDKLLNACKTRGWKTLISLCRLAGLRRGEALALPWSAIDWEKRWLTVFATKTGAKRIVPIEPKLYGILKDAAEHAPAGKAKVCDVNPHCIWRNFSVIRKHAELPEWEDAFQVMRRNCETDWAQRFPQYAVSEWLGHDITVSATHYLAVPEELYTKVSSPMKPAGAEQEPQPAGEPTTDQAV